MSLLLVAYMATLALRRRGQFWPLLDNWSVDGFEITAGLFCLVRGFTRRPGRAVALVMGSGLVAWALGDLVWTLESQGGASPPTPSLADGFYLTFYPLMYLAVMLLIRPELRVSQLRVWLDGAVAGLGAAAICAAFAFDTILRASGGGSSAAVATNLAYPIGDLILLVLVVGALTVARGWPRQWLLLAAGCALLAVGDTIYLFQSSAGTYRVGTLLDATWPTALLLSSGAIWLPNRRSRFVGEPQAPGFMLPGLAAASGLVILLYGDWRHVSGVALALAGCALFVAGIRTILSLRDSRALTAAHRRQAVTDELTGLGNRRQLVRELDRFFGELSDAPASTGRLALLLIDLDHFKEINDSFGHPTGDELLQQIGPRVHASLRGSDVVVRLGGDEFAVVLTGADAQFATTIAERITVALERPIRIDTASLHVSASIGIALAPAHASDAAELLRCADVAMYRAKAAHRPYDTYEAALDRGSDRMRLMEELRAALDGGQLVVYYQPQVDLKTGEIATVEALLRWPHPTRGFVPPDEFIPLAEEGRLMRPLTAFVLEQALAQCAAWRASGNSFAVAVNLSATNLLDAELPSRIAALLEQHGLPAAALVLEITESTVMADLERSQEVIQRLSDVGLVVSIDDFGTGFSSLAYLSHLAVGELKLDRLFTARLAADGAVGRDEAIVRSAIELGHSLGMRVVAEGIERADIFNFMNHLGCDLAQGYAISFPLPPAELDFQSVDRAARHMDSLGFQATEDSLAAIANSEDPKAAAPVPALAIDNS